MRRTLQLLPIIIGITSTQAFSASDPQPGVSCSQAKETVKASWYVPNASDWNRRAAQKHAYCTGGNSGSNYSSSGDPEPGVSCSKARETVKASWYVPNASDWNRRAARKHAYCTGGNSNYTTGSSSVDPQPGISCSKARETVKASWYVPNGSDWNRKAGQKHAYCTGSSAFRTASTSSSSTSNSGGTSLKVKWQPGHYFRIMHDSDRNKNLVSDTKKITQIIRNNNALKHVNGYALHLKWGDMEQQKGNINFKHIDNAMALLNTSDTKHMKFFLMLSDRSFYGGCSGLPAYVKGKLTDPNLSRKCFAPIWTEQGSNDYQTFVDRVLKRYSKNPRILGVITSEESAVSHPVSKKSGFWKQNFQYSEKRLKYWHSRHPNMILSFGVNWFGDANISSFASKLASAHGSMTWPDTIPPNSSAKRSGLTTHREHYNTASRNSKKLAVIAGIQSPDIDSSIQESRRIYSFLNYNVGAQFMLWEPRYYGKIKRSDTYADKYLTKSVLPVLKENGGNIQNKSYPY